MLWRKLRGSTSYELLHQFQVKQGPVPVDQIAEALGIRLLYVSEPGWEGACKTSEDQAWIWVRKESPAVRQRLTIAHEIGHIIMHALGEVFRDVSPGVNENTLVDQEATAYGMALLMPKHRMLPLMYHSNHSVEDMARMFHVSPACMSIRLMRLMNPVGDEP